MRKLFVEKCELVRDNQVISTSYSKLRYDEFVKKDEQIKINTFEEFKSYAHHLVNCYHDTTLFKHREVYYIDRVHKITEKNFTPMVLTKSTIDRSILKYSFADLMCKLTTEELILYLKDRGLTACPILANK